MKKVLSKNHIKIWIPIAYCILLSLVKLNTIESTGDMVFFVFLPICFFIVGSNQYEQLKRIEELELSLKSK